MDFQNVVARPAVHALGVGLFGVGALVGTYILAKITFVAGIALAGVAVFYIGKQYQADMYALGAGCGVFFCCEFVLAPGLTIPSLLLGMITSLGMAAYTENQW